LLPQPGGAGRGTPRRRRARAGQELGDELPGNEYQEAFAPDFRLHPPAPAEVENLNTREYLQQLLSKLMANLSRRAPRGAAGVGCAAPGAPAPSRRCVTSLKPGLVVHSGPAWHRRASMMQQGRAHAPAVRARRLRPPDGVPFAERPPDTLSAEDVEAGAPPRGRLWDGTPAADADSGSYGGAGARGARVDAPADAAGARPRRGTRGLNARPAEPSSARRGTHGQPTALAAWDPWRAPPPHAAGACAQALARAP